MRTILIFSVFFLSVATYASAAFLRDSVMTHAQAFRSYTQVEQLALVVPTVIEVPFDMYSVERLEFGVIDAGSGEFQPYYYKKAAVVNKIPMSIQAASLSTSSARRMIDESLQTYAEFQVSENAHDRAAITLTSTRPITSSSLTALLDANVALPNTVEIRAMVNGQNRIVVAKRAMNQHTIRFPKTTSNNWTIAFEFGQPLRISELDLHQDNVTITSSRAIRFLAQPGAGYRIYFDPDQTASIPVGESGNLASAKDITIAQAGPLIANPFYIISDIDEDGVADIYDNCVRIANADQLDINSNGRGDACDDFDQDGIINSKDNCPDDPNRNQKDRDSDGIGDECDSLESRITEQYPWIPWLGIGFAAIVLIVLMILTVRSKPQRRNETSA